jgi:hypothetical protein
VPPVASVTLPEFSKHVFLLFPWHHCLQSSYLFWLVSLFKLSKPWTKKFSQGLRPLSSSHFIWFSGMFSFPLVSPTTNLLRVPQIHLYFIFQNSLTPPKTSSLYMFSLVSSPHSSHLKVYSKSSFPPTFYLYSTSTLHKCLTCDCQQPLSLSISISTALVQTPSCLHLYKSPNISLMPASLAYWPHLGQQDEQKHIHTHPHSLYLIIKDFLCFLVILSNNYGYLRSTSYVLNAFIK